MDMEVEVTGEDGPTTEVMITNIKQEPLESPKEQSTLSFATEDEEGEIVYMGTEIVLRYLQGELTFEQFSSIVEAEVKEDPDQPEIEVSEEVINNVEVETEEDITDTEASASSQKRNKTIEKNDSQDQSSVKRQRKPRPKLPKHAQGLMGEANMRFATGEKEDAIKICMEVIKMAPNAPEPYQTLGMIYEEQNNMERALQFLFIAAHLNSNNRDEWMQLADMFLEHDNPRQALACYTRAIKQDKKCKDLYFARIDVLEKLDEDSKKIIEDQQKLLELFGPEEGEAYFNVAVKLTMNFHTSNEKEKALDTLQKAFEKHANHARIEAVNILLELLLWKRSFQEALKILIRHCGVKIIYPDRIVVCDTVDKVPDLPPSDVKPTSCEMTVPLAVDLRAKLAICFIHLKYDSCIDTAMYEILLENVDEIGDLYLDIIEAYVENAGYAKARPLLYALVNTEDYNLAAVWLQYAECLSVLGELQAAASAFQQVLNQAPGHRAARLSLSAIQQQLGRPELAIQVLQQGEADATEEGSRTGDEVSLDLELKLPKCSLLYQQKRYNEFVEAAQDAIFKHLPGVFSPSAQRITIATRSTRNRQEYVREMDAILGSNLREVSKAFNRETLVTHEALWNLLMKLMDALIILKRYKEMEDTAIGALLHPAFQSDEHQRELHFIVIHSCILARNGLVGYDFVRDLCLRELENNQAWNLFAQIVSISQNMRHNRFCLRLMFKYPDHKALGILNGHNALVAGTYKHALAEYVTAFRNRPEDPFLSFCIGITFVHLASQRFAAKRHSLTVQACAFFNQYLELRGECQETLYNLGRAFHQLGLYHAAVYYYEKGLKFPPMIKNDSKFDLTKELAFNLCLIYKNSGSHDLARYITQKYLVI